MNRLFGRLLDVARIPNTVRPAYDVESLTDLAVAVFTARGYDATRMEHIARAANVSKSSLYHHVANKEELLGRALGRAVGALTAILEEPGAQAGRPRERLEYGTVRLGEEREKATPRAPNRCSETTPTRYSCRRSTFPPWTFSGASRCRGSRGVSGAGAHSPRSFCRANRPWGST